MMNKALSFRNQNIITCYSGSTQPTVSTQYNAWYDTANNIVKLTNDTGATWIGQWSLPICVTSTENGVLKTVDQIFNGFGYIGSTVFALPGVKGLIPDGKNTDGSLKNIEWTNEKILLTSRNTSGDNKPLIIGITRPITIGAQPYTESAVPLADTGSGYSIYLNTAENILYVNNGTTWVTSKNILVATLNMTTGGVISSLSPKSVEGYTKSVKVAAVFKGSQRVYGKSTRTLARPFNPSSTVSLSTTKNTADKDLWIFTHLQADANRYLYTSKADGSNQVTLQSHIWHSGYTGAKGSDMTIVNKGWKYWIDGSMTTQGAYRMEDPDVEYLSNTSYDRYVPKPNYTTGVSQTKDTVYYASKNVWVQIPSVRAERAIYVGKTNSTVTIQAAHNKYGGYSADSSTMIFIPKGWYYKSTGTNHTRWLCEGE
jgi:hypothetical protein